MKNISKNPRKYAKLWVKDKDCHNSEVSSPCLQKEVYLIIHIISNIKENKINNYLNNFEKIKIKNKKIKKWIRMHFYQITNQE